MNSIARQDGQDPRNCDGGDAHRPQTEAQARLERRAEALRANLKRRKAQSRSRAEAERAGQPD